MSEPFVERNPDLCRELCPAGLVLLRGADPGDSAERSIVFVAGHHLWRGIGVQTFNLPDLRGRVPIHQGNGYIAGELGGGESVTLTSAQLPAHTHTVHASDAHGNASSPAGALWATDGTGVSRPLPQGRQRRNHGRAECGYGSSQRWWAASPRTGSPSSRSPTSLPCLGFTPRRTEGHRRPTMSEPFLAEVRILPYNFAPIGWALCQGQLLAHSPEHGRLLASRDQLRR